MAMGSCTRSITGAWLLGCFSSKRRLAMSGHTKMGRTTHTLIKKDLSAAGIITIASAVGNVDLRVGLAVMVVGVGFGDGFFWSLGEFLGERRGVLVVNT